MDNLTVSQAQKIISAVRESDTAALFLNNSEAPQEMIVVDLALTTAQLSTKPYIISFPFKSVFVRDASDSTTNISMRVNTDDNFSGAVVVKKNDSLSFPVPQAKAYLHWAAQPGKTMQLVFFVTGAFQTGSQISQTGGGVAIVDGSAFAVAPVVLTGATGTQVFSANSDRKLGTFENDTGADLWVGPATVTNAGATKGIRVPTGAFYQWRNTAALYAYSVAGATIITMEES